MHEVNAQNKIFTDNTGDCVDTCDISSYDKSMTVTVSGLTADNSDGCLDSKYYLLVDGHRCFNNVATTIKMNVGSTWGTCSDTTDHLMNKYADVCSCTDGGVIGLVNINNKTCVAYSSIIFSTGINFDFFKFVAFFSCQWLTSFSTCVFSSARSCLQTGVSIYVTTTGGGYYTTTTISGSYSYCSMTTTLSNAVRAPSAWIRNFGTTSHSITLNNGITISWQQ